MTFQIKKLILWPKKEGKSVRTVDFALNKVNVITGDSRTGKSAIVPIIDYCLASSDCLIPRDIIRDNVAWYGLLVSLGGDKYTLFARKESDDDKPADIFILKENITEDAIPPSFDESHDKVNGDYVKSRLNAIANIPYVRRDADNGRKVEHLSFRDVSHINLQAQEVMASQSVFFYKVNRGIYHTRLSDWFRFLIGSEPQWRIVAQQDLKSANTLLANKEKSLTAMQEVANERLTQLKGLIVTAKEFGFCCENSDVPDDRVTLLSIAEEVINAGHKWENSTTETISDAEKTYRKLIEDDNRLGTEIAIRQKKLSDLAAFKDDFTQVRSIAAERRDHLAIVEWFKANQQSTACTCPFCGSETNHDGAKAELAKLTQHLQHYSEMARIDPQLPRAYEEEERSTIEELGHLLAQRRALRERFDVVRHDDENARRARHHAEEVFTLLGRIEAELQYNRKVDDPDGLAREVAQLKGKIRRLEAIVHRINVDNETERILTTIGELARTRMRSLDCDEKYTAKPPMFDYKNLNIILTDDRDRRMALTQVGSASNWVSCHIAFTCALQEYFASLDPKVSYLPSFMVYDQPSQVYFPKMMVRDDHHLDDTDRVNVTKMFKTIVDSIKATGYKWQAIILEHAESSIYREFLDSGDLNELPEWRNGEKLIPEDWL